MKAEPTTKAKTEQELVRIYMDLTGCTESNARSVIMLVEPDSQTGQDPGSPPEPGDRREVVAGQTSAFILAAGILWMFGSVAAAQMNPPQSSPVSTNLLRQPISLGQAVDLALHANPSVLRAQKDVEVTQGVVMQTRAIVLPKAAITGNYSAVDQASIDKPPGLNFSFGSDQSWRTQFRVVQSIYEGGRMVSALRSARLTTEQSMLNYRTVLADTIVAVQISYYDVLLADQQITVQKASVELLQSELANTTRRYDAGTVPRFNVLRAEVELANAKPRLIQAQNRFRVSKNVLTTLLGLNLPPGTGEDIPLQLSGRLEAEPYDIQLSDALMLAFERRSELGSLRKGEALRQEDVKTARAGYKPSLEAFAGYDIHSSMFSNDLTDQFNGWLAGVQLNWNIFDGFQTRGKVKQAQALYERAGLELDDARRRIELDVRTAFSNFIEAREVLGSTTKVVEQAEEAVRLAQARNDAGTGTQLDVLSAQTALTDARTTQVQSLRDYEVARARLERAVGMNLPETATRD